MTDDYTLIHSPAGLIAARSRLREQPSSRSPRTRPSKKAPAMKKTAAKAPAMKRAAAKAPAMKKAAAKTPAMKKAAAKAPAMKKAAAKTPAVEKAAGSASGRQAGPEPARRIIIGIWSLDAVLEDLADVITALNKVQVSFAFFVIEASVPSGLVSRPERMVPWLKEKTGRRLTAKATREICDNIIANDYFGIAEGIRFDLGLDYIVGITPAMVAGENVNGVYYNHFSTYDGHAVLASSYDLHRYAKQTGRPFQAFIIKIVVSQILVAMFFPALGFHDDNGCLFDYDGTRETLVGKVDDPRIEPTCLQSIDEPYRKAAIAMSGLIRDYGRGST